MEQQPTLRPVLGKLLVAFAIVAGWVLPIGMAATAHTGNTEHKQSVHVNDYGAVPNDSGDDTAAIRNAITAASGWPRSDVVFSAGRYRINDMVTLHREISVDGNNAWVEWYGPTGGTMFRLGESSSTCAHVTQLRNIQLDGRAIAANNVYSNTIQERSGLHNVGLFGYTQNGILVDGVGSSCVPANFFIESVEAYPSDTGSNAPVGVNLNLPHTNVHHVRDVTAMGVGGRGYGIRFNDVQGGIIDGAHSEHSSVGVLLERSSGIQVTNVHGCCGVGTVVRVGLNGGVNNTLSNIVKRNPGGSGITLVRDDLNNVTIEDWDLGLYAIGPAPGKLVTNQ